MSEVKTESPKVNIFIDGIPVQAEQGSMIIEAADKTEGVVIPRFCYHKKLSVAANCRMCLVELENGRKPMPACATPVSEGMKVFTKSPNTMAYQKAVMEFLLINHPLDCPICDQGGECELQDIAMGYGKDVSRYTLGKRSVPEKNIGPLVATDLTRCIHCTRCVRFGQEIAGLQELGMTGRGEHSEISSFLGESINSEMSGNIIDLCPVGALTSKPFRFKARPWELQQLPSIGFHDCVGSHIYGHVRRGKLMRVVPRENENINEVWLSDRDRFSYEGLFASNRATQVLLKNNKSDKVFKPIEWTDALEHIVKISHEQCRTLGPSTMAALLSPSSTVEEGYLLQKLFRQIGSGHIDYRLRQQDFKADLFTGFLPGIDCQIDEIENFDMTLLIGSNVRYEQPIIHHRIRNAVRDEGSSVMSINPQRFNFRFRHHDSWIINHHEMPDAVGQVLKAVLEQTIDREKAEQVFKNTQGLDSLLKNITVSEQAILIAKNLLAAKKPVIFLGGLAIRHPQYSLLLMLSKLLAELTNAKGGVLTAGSNAAGLAYAGCLPHRGAGYRVISEPSARGATARQILTGETNHSVVFLINLDPGLDTGFGSEALSVLKRAKLVVAITPFITDCIKDVADIILPMAATPETSGTFVNASGQWQNFSGMAMPPGEARPGWKILRVLGNFFKQSGFEYESTEDILSEVKTYGKPELKSQEVLNLGRVAPLPIKTGLARMNLVPLYGVDMLVRHAEALSQTPQMNDLDKVMISPALAAEKNLDNGDKVKISVGSVSVQLIVLIEPTLADRTVSIFQSRLSTLALGNLCEGLHLEKIQ